MYRWPDYKNTREIKAHSSTCIKKCKNLLDLEINIEAVDEISTEDERVYWSKDSMYPTRGNEQCLAMFHNTFVAGIHLVTKEHLTLVRA